MERGVFFEVRYAQALRGNGARQTVALSKCRWHTNVSPPDHHLDPTARRNFIANLTNLVRVTRGGKQLVVSSGANSPLDVRGPFDVMNL